MNMHMPMERVIPHNIEAEQALLGAILTSNDALFNVAEFLLPEHFYDPAHQAIYEVCQTMIQSGRSVSPITIKSYLPETIDARIDGQHVTTMQYLARLAAAAYPASAARDLGVAVHEMWIRRRAIAACDELVSAALEMSPEKDILGEVSKFEEEVARLRGERVRLDARGSISESYINSLSAAYQRGEVAGVPIALDEVAKVISEPCFEAGNLYGLLSSSGEGKTSLTVQLMLHALKRGHPVCFLSYDQSSDQIVRQMIAQEHEIEARRQRDAKYLSEKEFETCLKFGYWLKTQPLEIIKCSNESAPQLVGYARTFVRRFGRDPVPLVVVDHIGVVRPEDRRADEGTKAKGIGQILKAGAEMTGASWLVLNQRNTFGMKRDNPRPISSDLFGGDPAKTPFDAIFYLYRFLKFYEERLAIASTDSDRKKIEQVFPSAVREGEDIAEIGAIKVRFGPPNIRETMKFNARFTRYESFVNREQGDLL